MEVSVTHDDGYGSATTSSVESAPSTSSVHIGTLTGKFPSKVYVTGQETFDWPIWTAAGTIGTVNDIGKIWLNKDFATADNWSSQVIAHERGHNLGYRHEDGGIMVEPFEDIDSPELAEVTRAVADHTDGFEYWHFREVGHSDIAGLTKGYINRSIPVSRADVQWAVKKYLQRANIATVLADGTIERELAAGIEEHTDYTYNGAGFYRSKNVTVDGPWGWQYNAL